MADFGSDVMKSTQEESPSTTNWMQDLLRRRAEATAQQFGQKTGGMPAPEASLADTMKAQRAGQIGEFDRRKQAATGQYDFAQQAGQQAGDISDRIRSALFGRQQATGQISEAQRQQALTAGQAEREAAQGFGQKIQELGFARYKTDSDRLEAMNMAYKKGTLDNEMLLAAREGSLKMADIDRAFQIKYNTINNAFLDWKAFTEQDLKATLDSLATDAKNTSSMIDGLFDIGGAVMTNYGKKNWGREK